MDKLIFDKKLKLSIILLIISVFLVSLIACTGIGPKVFTSPKTKPFYFRHAHSIKKIAILGLILGTSSDFAGHISLRTTSLISEELYNRYGISSIVPIHDEIVRYGAVLPGHFTDLKFTPGHNVGDIITNEELALSKLCKYLNVDSLLSYVIFYEGIDLGEPSLKAKNMLKLVGNTAYGISISIAMGIFAPLNSMVVSCEVWDQISNVYLVEGKAIGKDRIHWVEKEPTSSMFVKVYSGDYEILWPFTPKEVSDHSSHLSAVLIKKLFDESENLNCIAWKIPYSNR